VHLEITEMKKEERKERERKREKGRKNCRDRLNVELLRQLNLFVKLCRICVKQI
jgi:hypothetical protein